MNNYRSDDIDDSNADRKFSCPYFVKQFQCPLSAYYRQESEGFQRQQQGPPTSPPPSFTPQLSDATDVSLLAVDPGAIAPCVFRFSYIWLNNGKSFWAYLVFVGKTSASGWRYTGGRWVYFGVDLNEIKTFICY